MPSWQESHHMYSLFAECAKRAPSLAISARNACFSRSEWQDPRLMYPFPGAIGRFRIHGARILPPRPPFRVERPDITHSAKNLPALPGFSAAAACGLRHGRTGFAPCGRAWLACRMRGPLPSRPRPPPALLVARSSRAPPAFRAHRARCADFATCARHPRPAPPQTSGTARATQCGHKNGIPERGSH